MRVLSYKCELRAGDVISVRSDIVEVRDKSVRIAHEMSNDETGEIVASMIPGGRDGNGGSAPVCR